jgi:penicillin-binding protein-related factor A (putative recombinase)
MTESDMQTLFRKHIEKHPPINSEVFELKICKGTSLPFDALKEHQISALKDAQINGLFHKLTDPPIFYGGQMRFNVPRPFDCMYLKNVQAFVILWFYKPRTPKIFIKIPILDWLDLQSKSERKSITEQMAKEIGTEILIT